MTREKRDRKPPDAKLGPSRSSSVQKALGAKGPVAGPADLPPVIVAFANGDIRPSWQAYTPAWVDPDGEYFGPIRDIDNDEVDVVSEAEARRLGNLEIETQKQLARDMLEAAAKGTSALATWLAQARKHSIRTNVRLEPAYSFREGRFTLSYQMHGPNQAAGWIVFTAGVLADSAKGELTGIGRCRFEHPLHYFYGPRDGRLNYCPGTDHYKLQNVMESAERQAKRRAGLKARARRHK